MYNTKTEPKILTYRCANTIQEIFNRNFCFAETPDHLQPPFSEQLAKIILYKVFREVNLFG